MELLASLLLKYKNLVATDDVARNAIRTSVKEQCDIDIPPHAIKVNKGMISLSVHPLEKRAIQEHKERIILALKEAGIDTEVI